MDTVLALREAQYTAAQAIPLLDRARALVVDSHERFEEAGAFKVEVRRHRKNIKAAFDPVIAAGLRAHREALALYAKADAAPAEAEAIIEAELKRFQREQERIRQAAEERAAAERRRLEAEQRAEAECVRKILEAEAEAARIRNAETAMDAGDLELAQVILESPPTPVLMAPPPPVEMPVVEAPPAPKAAGISFVHSWTYRIIDEQAITRAYLRPDEQRIARVVKALGPEAAAAVGGIEVVRETGLRTRTA